MGATSCRENSKRSFNVEMKANEDLLRDVFGQPRIARQRMGVSIDHSMIRDESLVEAQSNFLDRLRGRIRLAIHQDKIRSVHCSVIIKNTAGR
jgi:hypothetical protein